MHDFATHAHAIAYPNNALVKRISPQGYASGVENLGYEIFAHMSCKTSLSLVGEEDLAYSFLNGSYSSVVEGVRYREEIF